MFNLASLALMTCQGGVEDCFFWGLALLDEDDFLDGDELCVFVFLSFFCLPFGVAGLPLFFFLDLGPGPLLLRLANRREHGGENSDDCTILERALLGNKNETVQGN